MTFTTSNSSDAATQTIVVESSAIIIPATKLTSSFTDFILHRLHVAELRAKIIANEIEATATALSGGLISPETAILILAECGLEISSF